MYINISHIWHNYHQKMITHHFVMTLSLLIKILKIDKFCDFSCDIDYNSRTEVFRDVISHIFNHGDHRQRIQIVCQPRSASSEARL